MDGKTKRLLLLVVCCSAAGVVLGGTASWAESNHCLQESNITSECLNENPVMKTLQGMSTGLIAGAGGRIARAKNKRIIVSQDERDLM